MFLLRLLTPLMVGFAIVTAAVFYARADAPDVSIPPSAGEWTISLDVQITTADGVGQPDTLYRREHFPDEKTCKDYIASPDFLAELSRLSTALQKLKDGVVGLSNWACVPASSSLPPV